MSTVPIFVGKAQRRLNHLELHIQSSQIEEAIRLISDGRIAEAREHPNRWGDLAHYVMEMGANGIPLGFPGFGAGRFDMWGSRELLCARAPHLNLSPLLAVGLSSGVVIPVSTVMSNKQLQQYTDGLQNAVNQFYVDFLRSDEINMRILVEQYT